jgi:transcriptional regulator with XRE-family HTH domain
MVYKSLNELVTALSPYLNQSSLARICDINEGQMRQYISGVRNPSPQTIRKINEGLYRFGEKIRDMKIVE